MLIESPVHALRLWFQAVPEPRNGKNRMHFDIEDDDPAVELDRPI